MSVGTIETTRPVPRLASPAFETVYVGLASLILIGSYIDVWAHRHLDSTLETFLTPWHGLLYGAYLATAFALAWATIPYRGRLGEWRQTIPARYGYAVAGAVLFGVAGIADLAWHTLFGIEAGVEALLSPTHLGLAAALTLMVGAPFRAAALTSRAANGSRVRAGWPAYLSLTLVVTLVMGLTQYLHPFADFWPTYGPEDPLAIGVASFVIQSAVLAAGFVLMVRRLGPVRTGAVSLLMGAPALGLAFVADTWLVLPIVAAAAVVAEVIVATTRARLDDPPVLRAVTFAILIVLWAIYDSVLGVVWGINWSIHAWTGTIILAGLVGWLVAYVVTVGEARSDPGGEVRGA